MLPGKRVGVVAVGQQQHLDVHALLEQHIRTAHRRMDTSLVTIVEQRDVLCKPSEQFNLIHGECRSRVGHHVLQSTLVHGNHIGIALHHIHTVLLGYGFLSLIESVELPFLMIDLRVGRVHIFLIHTLRTGIEQTTAEGHHLAADVQPRENHATCIAVVDALLASDTETCLDKVLSLITRLLRRPGQCITL